jgi:hypothetical protein
MFNSLKRQQRVRIPGGGTMSAKPVKSGRDESSIASSDEGELNAIANAVRKGQPIYFIQSAEGTTLDVTLSKTGALERVNSEQQRARAVRHRVKVFERLGSSTALMRVG